MFDEIFAGVPAQYIKGSFPVRTTFYFSVDDIKKTLVFDGDSCTVLDGKGETDADCVCKMSRELFLKIWQDGYQPGLMDFVKGAIKSNAPQLLQQFMHAFGR